MRIRVFAPLLACALALVSIARAQSKGDGAPDTAPTSSPSDDDIEVPSRPEPAPPIPSDATPIEKETPPAESDVRPRDGSRDVAGAPTPPSSSETPPGEAKPAAVDTDSPKNIESTAHSRPVPMGFHVSGYLQAQFEGSQISEDQLQQGGLPYNRDRFVLRRARLRVDRGWEYAAGALEIDGNYFNTARFSVRRAEGSLLYRGPSGGALPLVMFTLGVFETPFGYELMDSSRSRWFMERSTASLAFFPAEPDIGARVSGAIGFFRYALAVVNGEPLDDRSPLFTPDPNAAKDVVGRLGVVTQPLENLSISGGTSFLQGTGFHAGASATKDTIVWVDVNEDGKVDNGEVNGVAGRAAVPSQNFRRWAFGADLQLRWRTAIGTTTLYGEAYVASNLDRGLVVADPIATGADSSGSERTGDVREIGGHVGFLQEIGRHAILGFRGDVYDPNSDFLRQRQGRLLPATYTITTWSPLVGFVLRDQARLLFQYDFIKDHFGKDSRGIPKDLRNDQWTLRLQVAL